MGGVNAGEDLDIGVTAPTTRLRGKRMSLGALLILLLAVALAATGQVLLKHGMSEAVELAKETDRSLAVTAATSFWVVGGLAIFAVSAVAWLLTLSRVPLHIAYPFNALGYLGILTASVLVLHEKVNAWTVIGSTMVVAGLIVVVTLSPSTQA
jgi:drug/metabolite transporter (DMT)-like permease